VIWDLRMATSSVRNFGAASKAVLHQVDIARRVQQYYETPASTAAAGAAAATAGGSNCSSASVSSPPLIVSALSMLAGGGSGSGISFGVGSSSFATGGLGLGLAAAALGGGGGCFFSQLLPCPADPRLLAFVQTNMQVRWCAVLCCAGQ